MIWTCPNCNKKIEISQDQLDETGGMVICPQCLTSARVGETRRRQAPAQREEVIAVTSHEPVSTPPPRRPRRTAPALPPATPPPPRRKATSKSKKATRSSKGVLYRLAHPHSPLGCLWRSAVATVVLIVVYVIVGLIFSL